MVIEVDRLVAVILHWLLRLMVNWNCCMLDLMVSVHILWMFCFRLLDVCMFPTGIVVYGSSFVFSGVLSCMVFLGFRIMVSAVCYMVLLRSNLVLFVVLGLRMDLNFLLVLRPYSWAIHSMLDGPVCCTGCSIVGISCLLMVLIRKICSEWPVLYALVLCRYKRYAQKGHKEK